MGEGGRGAIQPPACGIINKDVVNVLLRREKGGRGRGGGVTANFRFVV